MILELAYAEGMPGPEIARVLDVPVNTVYSRLSRAKRSLRELLERECPDYSEEELGSVLTT
jgi:DNA-directed RNA polymerase specialized sigma24 family protein